MIILPHKERYIQENFIEFSFNDEDLGAPNYDLFKKLNSTDQYYLAEHYNWDDGVEVLNWIIDSPRCDKGTASLIFWMAEPDYYFKYSSGTVQDYEKDVFELLQKIIRKFRNKEFTRGRLSFDPTTSVDNVEWGIKYNGWEIPEELKKPTKGIRPISLSLIQNLIWEWKRERRLKKREARKNKKRNAT